MAELTQNIDSLIRLILAVASVGLAGFAALDVVRRPTNLFPAVGRQTKVFWVALLAVALLLSILSFLSLNPLSLFNVAAVIAASVYLADVRPKIKQISGGRGSSDPYGGY